VHSPPSGPMENKLLASLPRAHFNLLVPHLTTVSLSQGLVVLETGEEVDHVYFPHDGMLSLLAVMRDGKAIETATVGREGVVGAMAGLGLYKSLVRIVVQLPTNASKIASSHFRKAVAGSAPLHNLCIQYNEVLLTQARVTAACNALHPVEARFCRWLLQSADRAASDTVPLTQELLAEMLGVRRTSVTEVAGKIQSEGVITYSRGIIKILDLARPFGDPDLARDRRASLAPQMLDQLPRRPRQRLEITDADRQLAGGPRIAQPQYLDSHRTGAASCSSLRHNGEANPRRDHLTDRIEILQPRPKPEPRSQAHSLGHEVRLQRGSTGQSDKILVQHLTKRDLTPARQWVLVRDHQHQPIVAKRKSLDALRQGEIDGEANVGGARRDRLRDVGALAFLDVNIDIRVGAQKSRERLRQMLGQTGCVGKQMDAGLEALGIAQQIAA
jgi:CRP-like cAMP-binding protein